MGNAVILAKQTMEITARASYRKGFGPREEVVEGLFLHWIHVHRSDHILHKAHHLTVVIDANAAFAGIPRPCDTAMGADKAFYFTILQLIP